MEICLRSPIVLQSIFKNLSAKELNSCARVCSTWNQIAQLEKRHRNPTLSWYFCKDCDDHEGSCEQAFEEYVNNLYCEPAFALIFATGKKVTWRKNTTKSSKGKKTTADGHILIKIFPISWDLMICTTRGFTATTSDFSTTKELLLGSNGITSVYFPKFQGVKIHRFQISDLRKKNLPCNIPSRDSIKCLLVFMDSSCSGQDKDALSNYINENEVTFGVGGGLVKTVNSKVNVKMFQGNFILAFTGNNVRSVSMVIPAEVVTAGGVEIVLEQFLESDIIKGQCIAFSFCCGLLGSSAFSHRNGACDAFRKLFPRIPLFGVLGDKEIGVTYIPGVPRGPHFNDMPMAYDRIFPHEGYYRSLSCVYVIISFIS